MPGTAPEVNPDEDTGANTRLQTILTIVRYVSIGAIALCVLPIVWMLFRRRMAAASAPTTPAPLARLNEELDRNPEALAKILALWIDQSEAAGKKAA